MTANIFTLNHSDGLTLTNRNFNEEKKLCGKYYIKGQTCLKIVQDNP